MATKVRKLPSGPHPLSRFCPSKGGLRASTSETLLRGGPFDGYIYRRSSGVRSTLRIAATGQCGAYEDGHWKAT